MSAHGIENVVSLYCREAGAKMVLEFQNVSKRYGGVNALQSVNLALQGGEIHALLGGNGSGKSTLIKIAAGLVKKDGGTVLLNGKILDIHSPQTAKKLKVVATAQELSILKNLTVAENLTLCAMPLHMGPFINRPEMRKKAEQILVRLGMAGDMDATVSNLPINKQYLLEFAKAIFQDFDVLLIDEITSALYRGDVEIVSRILKDYKAQGKIILFVSHRMSEIFSIADLVTVMRNGEIVSTYSLAQINSDTLLTDMVGHKERQQKASEGTMQALIEGKVQPEALLLSAKKIPIKSYGSTVDLDMRKGEIIGVAGLQGHGQSDLVQALFGLNGPIHVVLGETETMIASPQNAVKRGFAYVSGDRERDGSFKEHNLAANIKVVSELIFRQKMEASQVMKDLGIKFNHVFQKITSLSGGNQQKVIFGRWITTHPLLLLANDPSKGIDVNARAELREIMWKLTEEGMSILFVSSDEDELISLCARKTNARIIVMYEGTIVETLRGQNITRDQLIAATLAKGGGKIE